MAARKINPRQAAEVAPVNWKATQMLGIKFAPKKMRAMSAVMINENLWLSETNGVAEGKRRPSRFRRSGWKITWKTSMRCKA